MTACRVGATVSTTRSSKVTSSMTQRAAEPVPGPGPTSRRRNTSSKEANCGGTGSSNFRKSCVALANCPCCPTGTRSTKGPASAPDQALNTKAGRLPVPFLRALAQKVTVGAVIPLGDRRTHSCPVKVVSGCTVKAAVPCMPAVATRKTREEVLLTSLAYQSGRKGSGNETIRKGVSKPCVWA